MISPSKITEADILSDVIAPGRASLSADAAQSILQLEFSSNAHDRMADLCERGNRGEINAQEEAEVESYRRVALLLDLLQAKARLSLNHGQDVAD